MFRESDLATDADRDRQTPFLGKADAGPHSPPDEIGASTCAMGKHQVPSHLKVVSNSASQFESQMRLMLSRCYRTFKFLRTLADVVEMGLEIPQSLRNRFVLINLHLKRIL